MIITMTWVRHREKHARTCDRCRTPAVWNLSRPGLLTEYACHTHAEALAVSYGIPLPGDVAERPIR